MSSSLECCTSAPRVWLVSLQGNWFMAHDQLKSPWTFRTLTPQFGNLCNLTGRECKGAHNFGILNLKSFGPRDLASRTLFYTQIDSLFLSSVSFSSARAVVVKREILQLSAVHWRQQSRQEWLRYKSFKNTNHFKIFAALFSASNRGHVFKWAHLSSTSCHCGKHWFIHRSDTTFARQLIANSSSQKLRCNPGKTWTKTFNKKKKF